MPVGDDQCRFDYIALQKTIKNIIKDRLTDENCTMDDIRLTKSKACRSFVVAGTAAYNDAPPAIFRSYRGEGRLASKCAIWEAARATTAAPAFFKPIFIDKPPPGRTYVAGIRFSNPSELALDEAQHVWSTGRRFCLVSIGTGRQKTVRFANTREATTDLGEQRLLIQLQSYVPRVATYLSNRRIGKNLPPGVVSLITMTKANSGTNSEQVHERLLRSSAFTSRDKSFPYFRFNIEREDTDIGLDDWKNPEKVAVRTEAYIQNQETSLRVEACVRCLMKPPENEQALPKCFIVPRVMNPRFVGRSQLLNRVFDMLCETKPYAYNHRVALYGMGGIGKTETALVYTYSYKDYYRFIFWISGVTQASLLSGFQKIASIIDLDTTGSSTELAEKVLAWLDGHENWLLVIDNLDDISQISGYLPRIDSHGHTLITTRDTNVDGIPARGLEVGLLESDAAVQLLFLHLDSSAGDVDRPEFRSEAQAIVTELGFLPLAIEQSAAYIRASGMSIENYLPLYRKHRRELHQRVSVSNRSYPYSIATTWQIAVKSDPEAALLRFFAFLNPDRISLDFIKAGANGLDKVLQRVIVNNFALSTALNTLRQFSLIKLFEGGSAVTIHRLLQQTIQDSMTENERHKQWEQIIGLFHRAFPRETNESTRYLCRRYEDQVLSPLLACPEMKSEILGQCLHRVASFLNEDGKFQQAEIFAQKAFRIQIAIAGENDPATLTSKATLAYTYHGQGRWREAGDMYERVVEARTMVLGEEHPDTLTAKHNLVSVYSDLGRLADALSLEEVVLEARKRILGEEHQDTLRAMSNLASVYSYQGRLSEAVLLKERVLEIWRRTFGQEHPEMLIAMDSLASTYRCQGRLNEALNLEQDALEAIRRVLGEDHPDTLTSMSNLALIYRDQGRLDEAVVLNEKVLESINVLLGVRHPATLIAMSNLASTYRSLRRLDEALVLEETVLEATKAILGEEHSATLTSMSNLALTYQQQERWDEAVVLGETVVAARRKILGEQHPDTIQSMADLSSGYQAQGRWHDALLMDEMVVEGGNLVFGEHNLITLKFMEKLALSYWVEGRWDSALHLQEEMLETRKLVLGEHHPDTLTTMIILASRYRSVGRWDRANEIYRTILEARIGTLGEEHPDTSTAFAELKAFRSDPRTTEDIGLEEAVINWMARTQNTENYSESDSASDFKSLRSTSNTIPTRYSSVLPLKIFTDLEVNEGTIVQDISFLYKMAGKYPEDIDVQQGLSDAYAALGDQERAVKEWRRLTEKHPQSIQLERRLVAVYDNCEDPTKAIADLLELLDKRPNNLEYQECLSRAYLRNGNASEAITGWTRLVNTHPAISLVNKLDKAYSVIKDNDVAMEGWWAILEKHPTRMSVLRKLRETCQSKYPATFSRMSLFHFALLCFLSFMSRKFVQWDMGESNWRPLAKEDDLMMVRPYMEKRQWEPHPSQSSGTGAGEASSLDRQQFMSQPISNESNVDPPATGVDLNDLGQNRRRRGTPPGTPEEADSTRVKDDHLDDDKKMFEKLNKCYWRARGHLGRMSLVHSLTGMRVVKVKAYDVGGIHRVNITDMLEEKSDLIPPRQWRDFFLEPKMCKVGKTAYRTKLPLRMEPLAATYDGEECEGMCFEHTVNRGWIACTAILIVIMGITGGVVYGIKERDISKGGWIAAFCSMPIAVLALVVALWKDGGK